MNHPSFRRQWLGFLIRFLAFSFVFGFSVVFFVFSVPEYASVLLSSSTDVPTTTVYSPLSIVIDPGHGGEDGGTSSPEGILEKELNLSVSLILADFCRLAGLEVTMTRNTDTQIYDLYGDLEDYTGHKKMYDLRNRLRLTREKDASLFISIHMNQYPDSDCSGLQVYYSPNDSRSRDLAELLQNYHKTYLAPENNREVKRATASIYLLKQLEIPAVLVECGFLSNPEDTAKLTNEAYQKQLSLTAFCALSEYLSSPGGRS